MPKKAVTKKAPAKKAATKKAAAKKAKKRVPLVPLTGKQKSHLRSLAHALKAVVQIGHQGVTDGVVAALDAALDRHELIKVKISAEAELDAADIAPSIEKATHSQLAQIIGHTLVLYRRRNDSPKIKLPKPKAKTEAPAPAAMVTDDFGADDDDGDDVDDDEEDADDEDADDEEELE